MPGELMVEEYKSLRSELQKLAQSVGRWHAIGIVTAGVGGAAFVLTGHEFITLPMLIVMAGCIFGIIHDITSILRIAAYVQAFHEGHDTGALWETRLEAARGADVWVPHRPYMTPILSLLWIGLIMSIIPAIPVLAKMVFEPASSIGSGYVWSFRLLNTWPLLIGLVPIIWFVFWSAIRNSYVAFGPGGFKDQTLQAFRREGEAPSEPLR
jgi:hypothetical protein